MNELKAFSQNQDEILKADFSEFINNKEKSDVNSNHWKYQSNNSEIKWSKASSVNENSLPKLIPIPSRSFKSDSNDK